MVVVGGCVGGIATIGLRHAGDTPWRGVYGSKTPVGAAESRWRSRGWLGRVVAGCGRAGGLWLDALLPGVGGGAHARNRGFACG